MGERDAAAGAPVAHLPRRVMVVDEAPGGAGGDSRAELTRLYRMLDDERAARRAAEDAAARAQHELAKRTGEIERSATAGRQLLAGALNAEDHERVALVRLLHDYALQSLLAARQDLLEAVAGDESALEAGLRGLDIGVAQMRETLAGLHPAAMDHAGLGAGIRAIVKDAAERRGIGAWVEIEPGAGERHDVLLLSLASEIVSNVVLHADARNISVVLRTAGAADLLEITDDGRGFDAAATTRDALERGRIGLASARERAVVAGGELLVDSSEGEGTTVTVRLPN